jgi:CheY-like chemotaxis protein
MPIINKLPLNPRLLKDVQILIVDNNRDSRDLYAFLLESYGAKVTTLGSIISSLEMLNEFLPNLLICEMRFLGESVLPLIQRMRDSALSRDRTVPILGISTCPPASLVQQVQVKIEAYLLKPINPEDLVDQVWNLTLQSNIACSPGIHDYLTNQSPAHLNKELNDDSRSANAVPTPCILELTDGSNPSNTACIT